MCLVASTSTDKIIIVVLLKNVLLYCFMHFLCPLSHNTQHFNSQNSWRHCLCVSLFFVQE
ncbi:hypothetical protein GBAR_LOCUS631 [Geodia barretti]|uniref:Uncharacterized protein n=1 Tax=Geodia barretti TaxID=519541 RepID=A0AA35VYT9_GEOBA|nr:hypothetical protein GBAR_LOCUS631 [Geodia barretti]